MKLVIFVFLIQNSVAFDIYQKFPELKSWAKEFKDYFLLSKKQTYDQGPIFDDFKYPQNIPHDIPQIEISSFIDKKPFNLINNSIDRFIRIYELNKTPNILKYPYIQKFFSLKSLLENNEKIELQDLYFLINAVHLQISELDSVAAYLKYESRTKLNSPLQLKELKDLIESLDELLVHKDGPIIKINFEGMTATAPAIIELDNNPNYKDINNYFKIHEKQLYRRGWFPTSNYSLFNQTIFKAEFIPFPSDQNFNPLDIIFMMTEGILPIGLINRPLRADSLLYFPRSFLEHDLSHNRYIIRVIQETFSHMGRVKYADFLSWISPAKTYIYENIVPRLKNEIKNRAEFLQLIAQTSLMLEWMHESPSRLHTYFFDINVINEMTSILVGRIQDESDFGSFSDWKIVFNVKDTILGDKFFTKSDTQQLKVMIKESIFTYNETLKKYKSNTDCQMRLKW